MKRHPLAIAIAVVIDIIIALSWFMAQVGVVIVVNGHVVCGCSAAGDELTAFVISKLAPNMYNLTKHLTIHNIK